LAVICDIEGLIEETMPVTISFQCVETVKIAFRKTTDVAIASDEVRKVARQQTSPQMNCDLAMSKPTALPLHGSRASESWEP